MELNWERFFTWLNENPARDSSTPHTTIKSDFLFAMPVDLVNCVLSWVRVRDVYISHSVTLWVWFA